MGPYGLNNLPHVAHRPHLQGILTIHDNLHFHIRVGQNILHLKMASTVTVSKGRRVIKPQAGWTASSGGRSTNPTRMGNAEELLRERGTWTDSRALTEPK